MVPYVVRKSPQKHLSGDTSFHQAPGPSKANIASNPYQLQLTALKPVIMWVFVRHLTQINERVHLSPYGGDEPLLGYGVGLEAVRLTSEPSGRPQPFFIDGRDP